MSKIKDYGITGFETEVLFRHVLNINQIKHISKLLKILGRYMILDREMINIRAGSSIGLSYIKEAVNNKLVVEFKDQDKYYFMLGVGGIYFLASQGYQFHKLKLDVDQHDRERILTVNKYMIEKQYDICMDIAQSNNYDFFVAEANNKLIACYYKQLINQEKLRDKLQKMINSSGDSENIVNPDDIFCYEEISTNKIKITENAKLNPTTELYMVKE